MRFYSSTFDDYLRAVQKYNLHPELEFLRSGVQRFGEVEKSKFCGAKPNDFLRPGKLCDIPNMIFHGPPGVGKYSQVLHFLEAYSPRKLCVSKKLTAQYNKQNFSYPISDIHFEVDMSLLGCNSKLIWHEIFTQIVDIISIRPEKVGVIVCKNFHAIHTELLEIFYSYMQQYKSRFSATGDLQIQLKFIFITEHVSFIPTSIINNCSVVGVRRPTREMYAKLLAVENIGMAASVGMTAVGIPEIIPDDVVNIKEFLSFFHGHERFIANKPETKVYKNGTKTQPGIPARMKKSHIIVCDEIVHQMKDPKKLSFTRFRDAIYDIFIYNLDVAECVMYILDVFIREICGRWNCPSTTAAARKISSILEKSYSFFQYYNNNYRPIYHLESFFIYIIITHESEKGV